MNTFESIGLNGADGVSSAGDVAGVSSDAADGLLGRVLKSETGKGDLSEYLIHPLNYNGSNSLARIIRGVTGLLGNLNLAIVDIFMGLLQFLFERRNAAPGAN